MPALVVGADRLSDDGARPTGAVLWYPGFTADRLTNRAELAFFAERGWIAVALDAADHGGRRPADWDDRFGPHRSEPEWAHHFGMLVQRTAAEVPGVVDALLAAGVERVSIAGASMGGIIAYRALSLEPRLFAAVALLATPACPGLDEPPIRADRFAPRPVLSIVASLDTQVPPGAARTLHANATAYADAPDRFELIEYPESGHTMRGEDWWDAMARTHHWLSRWQQG